MIHLTYDQAVDELLKAVQARGDRFIYPDDWRQQGICQYVLENGEPGCIVGQVFHQLGADLTPLVGREDSPIAAGGRVGVNMDYDAERLLAVAQEEQDNQVEWGRAVSHAVASVKPSAVG